MKTLLTRYSALALMFAMLGLASCTEEDGPLNPGTNDIDSLAATALSSTSIRVRWSGGTANDQVVVTPTSGGTAVTVASANGVATITGLTLGQTYTIQVKNDDGESGTMTWAPARRWPFESNGSQTVRIYSTSAPSSATPSGLVIGPSDIHTASTELGEAGDIDMVFAYDADLEQVFLQSPDAVGSGIPIGTANETKFGNNPFYVDGGLDNDFYSASISSLIPTGVDAVNSVEVPALGSSDPNFNTSLVALFLTEDNHFGRVEIVPQSGGLLYGTETSGSATYDFIDVRVSYQTLTGTGYVARPRAPRTEYAPRTLATPSRKN